MDIQDIIKKIIKLKKCVFYYLYLETYKRLPIISYKEKLINTLIQGQEKKIWLHWDASQTAEFEQFRIQT